MIGQARADAGKVRHRLDAQPGQRGPGTDTRAQQDRRRADGAGGQGDAPPADLFRLAFACDVHANRPVAGDQDPVDQAVRPDGEVGPVPGGQQVGDRRRQAQAAPPVLRERAHAGRLRVVVVGDLGEAEAAADLEEGALDRDQLIEPPAADRDRAAAPVQLAAPSGSSSSRRKCGSTFAQLHSSLPSAAHSS